MANIKSQIKRNRQNEKRRLRNRDFRGAARSAVKDARTSFESGADAPAAVMAAISALDKAAQKGAIHPRNAARRKGRLMQHLAAMGMPAKAAAPVMEKEVDMPADQGKKAAKVEKEVKPKADAKKTAAKSSPRKTAEKKPAKKTAAKK